MIKQSPRTKKSVSYEKCTRTRKERIYMKKVRYILRTYIAEEKEVPRKGEEKLRKTKGVRCSSRESASDANVGLYTEYEKKRKRARNKGMGKRAERRRKREEEEEKAGFYDSSAASLRSCDET